MIGEARMRLFRPRALVICSATPQAEGPAGRRRAWELVAAVERSHEVHLAIVWDGPVNYAQWCDLAERTHRLTLLPRPMLRSPRRAIAELASTWNEDTAFDAVVCGERDYWPAVASVGARVHFCAGLHRIESLAPALVADDPADVAAAPAPAVVRELRRAA